jgi:hypothetical protein
MSSFPRENHPPLQNQNWLSIWQFIVSKCRHSAKVSIRRVWWKNTRLTQNYSAKVSIHRVYMERKHLEKVRHYVSLLSALDGSVTMVCGLRVSDYRDSQTFTSEIFAHSHQLNILAECHPSQYSANCRLFFLPSKKRGQLSLRQTFRKHGWKNISLVAFFPALCKLFPAIS